MLTGTLWYGQFFFYNLGHVRLGARYAFSSWAIHMILLVLLSTCWLWLSGNGKPAAARACSFGMGISWSFVARSSCLRMAIAWGEMSGKCTRSTAPTENPRASAGKKCGRVLGPTAQGSTSGRQAEPVLPFRPGVLTATVEPAQETWALAQLRPSAFWQAACPSSAFSGCADAPDTRPPGVNQ